MDHLSWRDIRFPNATWEPDINFVPKGRGGDVEQEEKEEGEYSGRGNDCRPHFKEAVFQVVPDHGWDNSIFVEERRIFLGDWLKEDFSLKFYLAFPIGMAWKI